MSVSAAPPRHASAGAAGRRRAARRGERGLDLGLLTLGITGLSTREPATLRAAYLAMGVFADILLVPISLTALGTGLALALGTRCGLFRHYWVLAKFVLTLIAATATLFALRPQIRRAVEQVQAGLVPTIEPTLVIAPTVALSLYVTMTLLSIYKPWGRTRYGTRVR